MCSLLRFGTLRFSQPLSTTQQTGVSCSSHYYLPFIPHTQGPQAMLDDMNTLIDSLKKRTLELEKQLSASYADVDRISLDLCKLRSRLLEDGVIKYLERQA
ncbi:hypothetical protein T265_07150 [Opisthorchis viverrini]|uniref:Uncharacterized protein n=1 Tax=Opisthorchis viverrini TaxID=6198 RepID=A0A074ZDP4_OPIVI|nr:hypothetical protein T265_07150 [Opisthorchis viverrini]KER25411.1 hypothetical protein T265_07150 [Opisthorchis viverrini]